LQNCLRGAFEDNQAALGCDAREGITAAA